MENKYCQVKAIAKFFNSERLLYVQKNAQKYVK